MYPYLSDKKILIIGLPANFEHLLQESFLTETFQTLHVPDGKNALEVIPEYQPDLILSQFDDRVQDIAWFEHFSSRHSLHNNRHVPVIFFSDQTTRDKYAHKMFDLGLSGWYTTTFSSHSFREMIENTFLTHEVVLKNIELRQQVKRSEFRYRDLIENANDFIFTLDDDGCFQYLNNRFTPLTGWDKETWLNKPFIHLVQRENRQNALEFYELAHQGKSRIFESVIVSNRENSPVLSFNISPIFEKGDIVGSMGIARDVTEKKKMEKEILELKNFNESIIQSMEAGLMTVDLEGRITSVNEGAAKTLEWQGQDVVGRLIKTVMPPDEADFLLANPRSPRSLRYSREMEMTLKSGKKIAIGFTTTDRKNNLNQKVGTIISFRDISELKRMQTEVIRMDRLASLGVLASGIAHEIKNPLAGIKTLAQTCLEEFEKGDSRIEYLTRIVRQVDRLNDLIKTVYAFARPKPPDRKHHQVAAIFNEVIHLVSKNIESSGVELEEDFATPLPELLIDFQQFQQVFLNLVMNAVEAMDSGGKLTIRFFTLSSVNASESTDVRKHMLSAASRFFIMKFIDTGTGISKDKLPSIFDPFFTTKNNGMGLGLSIVYRIIEEHQGDIQVESAEGTGTTFTITLPIGEIE